MDCIISKNSNAVYLSPLRLQILAAASRGLWNAVNLGGTKAMSSRRRLITTVTAAVLLLSAGMLKIRAQSVSSSIQGTVTDSSGAVVPGADVTLTNSGTGVTAETHTNQAGNYSFPSVGLGIYSLKIVRSGFATYQLSNFNIVVGQHATENVTLQVASTSQTVTVNAGGLANLLESGSNDLGSVIGSHSVKQLPLNGRNFLQLGLLSGATQSSSGSSVGQTGHPGLSINIAGNEPDYSAYLINGIRVSGSRTGNLALNISAATIDQFEVHYGFFMPDLGPNPGIVDVITKSGTNKFHGSVYEYVRNNQMEARNYFSTLPNGPYHQNQFGFDLGGPIIRRKLFFFTDYEGYRQDQSAFVGAYDPTAAMFKGDFSSLSTPIYNPFSFDSTTGQRQAFPGNIIPANLINPVAAKLLKYYLPGSSLSDKPNNIGGTPKTTLDSNQFTGRIDGNPTSKDEVFAQGSWLSSPGNSPGLFPLQGTSHPLDSEVVALGWTRTISPTMVNELRLGVVRDAVYQEGASSPGVETQLGITGTGDINGVPGINLNGYSNFGTSAGLLGDIDNTYEIHDTYSWLRGNNEFKFGGDLDYTRSVQSSANATARGSITFTNEFTSQLARNASGGYSLVPNTGNAFADFLLGVPTNGEAKAMPRTHYRWTQFAPYAQDSWKIRKHLTANLGISYFLNTPPNPTGPDKNLIHSFDFKTGEETFAALGQVNPELYSMTTTDIAPRIGLAWQAIPNTVVRAGWGLYYTTEQALGLQYGVVSQIITINNSIANSEPTPTYLLGKNTFPAVTVGKITEAQISTIKGPIQYLDKNTKDAYIEQWDLDVEHTFGRQYLLDVAYIGNQGHRLALNFNPVNCNAPGSLVCNNANNPYYPRYPYIQDNGSFGQSSYNSLLVKFRRQFSHGLSLLANYTWSKTLTNAQEGTIGTLNQTTCLKCDIGMALSNVPQSLIVSAVWDLPIGRNQLIGTHMNRYLNAVVGGWNLDFITTFQKGNPITVHAPNFTVWSPDNVRADRTCNGRSELKNKNLRTNGLYWLQTSCFAQPPLDHFGNSGFGILTGPGIDNWDMGVHKAFTIYGPVRFDFRSEFFNAWNHADFANPNSLVTSPNFGKVSSTQHASREIQLAGTLTF